MNIPGRLYFDDVRKAPLALSKALEENRRARLAVATELELLGDGKRPETVRLRKRLLARQAQLGRRNFFLRQMCLPLGLPISEQS